MNYSRLTDAGCAESYFYHRRQVKILYDDLVSRGYYKEFASSDGGWLKITDTEPARTRFVKLPALPVILEEKI